MKKLLKKTYMKRLKITSNLLVVDEDIPAYETGNRMHQKAVDDKASEFVGRDELRKKLVEHFSLRKMKVL